MATVALYSDTPYHRLARVLLGARGVLCSSDVPAQIQALEALQARVHAELAALRPAPATPRRRRIKEPMHG